MARVLRALAGRGVVDEGDDGSFALTAVGQAFLADSTGPARGIGGFLKSYDVHAWAELEHTLRTGDTAFEHHFGTTLFGWLADHSAASARFDRQMQGRTAAFLRASAALIDALPDTGTLVDVGGGNGSFLVAALQQRPGLVGVLFDQAHVVAAAADVLVRGGVADRARVEAGSFFEAVPAGADAYTMLSVLHDWNDEDALRILRRVREAMAPHATVVIGDAVLRGPNEWDWFKGLDLHMLVVLGGRERSEPEWHELLDRAGLRIQSIVRTPALGCVVASRR
jgi:hypothetical protein